MTKVSWDKLSVYEKGQFELSVVTPEFVTFVMCQSSLLTYNEWLGQCTAVLAIFLTTTIYQPTLSGVDQISICDMALTLPLPLPD